MEASRSLSKGSTCSFLLDMVGDIESSSLAVQPSQDAMQDYQENRGCLFRKNTCSPCRTKDYYSSNTSVVEMQQSGNCNSCITWASSSFPTNSSPQYFSQTNLQETEQPIFQSVGKHLDTHNQPPTPSSPWDTGELESLFSSSCCPNSPTSPQDWTPHSPTPCPISATPCPISATPCPISPTSPQYSTLHTPALNPNSPTSSQYATVPFPNLPASSHGPSLPSFSSIFSQSSISQSSDINNLQVSHNQSIPHQPNPPTFQNCGQAAQLSQHMQSSISQMGITNMVNPSTMANELHVASSLKQEISHQDLLSKRRDCAHELQQISDTQFSQVHQNNLQFADINSYGGQLGNDMQQNTLQWEHQNPRIAQGNFQGHQHNALQSQQNYPGPQQNLPENPHKSHQNVQMCIQSQHKTLYPIHFDQQPQQALENHQTNPWQSQNPHSNQQYAWQNLPTNQQNSLMPQQNLQTNLDNSLQLPLKCQRYQQNILDPHQSYLQAQLDQKIQAVQENTLLPQQNFQMNQEHLLLQHNVRANQHDPYQYLATNQPNIMQQPHNLDTIQEYPFQSQQNLPTNQHNLLQQPDNLSTNQQYPFQSQQNLLTNQHNLLQQPDNLSTNQQYPFQSQQNLPTNQHNLLQQPDNLSTDQQNPFESQQNLPTNQHNSLQQTDNLSTNQQYPFQSQQNLLTNQHNSLQQQHDLGTNQQPCQHQQHIQLNQQNTWQLQQISQTNQQNALQPQQSYSSVHSTVQQNPWQLVQNVPTNQENPYLQQISQNHQPIVWPSQQNSQTNQPYLPQFNLQTNQHSILKEQQNIQNLKSTRRHQYNQQTMFPYDQQSGIEFSTQQEQMASNLLPVNRDPVLNCAVASISHQPETVQEQVTSQRLPTGHLPVSNSTGLLKYLSSRNHKAAMQEKPLQIPSQLDLSLLEFISQKLFQNKHSVESISYDDIQLNPEYIQFLKELTNLGQMAKTDLSKLEKWPLQKNQQQQYTSFLTDNTNTCEASSRNSIETGQEMPAEEELLCQENKWEELIKLADVYKQEVNKLAANSNQMAGEWFEDISKRCKQIEVMFTELKSQNKCSGEFENANYLTTNRNLADHMDKLTAEMCQKIEHNSLVQCLSNVCDCLSNFMEKWRCLEARKYVKLTPTPDDNYVKRKYEEFGAMYTTYFDCLGNVGIHIARLQETFLNAGVKSNICAAKKQLYTMRLKLLLISWFYEKQPSTCYLTSEKKDLYIRLFGVKQSNIDEEKSKMYIFPQAYYEKRFDEQYLCKESSIKIEECKSDNPAAKQSLRVAINLGHSNIKRSSKRNSEYCFEQMHRVCLVITLKANPRQEETEQSIECLSLPFTVRSGSEQLWESAGAVTWHCFFEDNLYKLPPTFTQTSTIDQIMCMLQAVLDTRDPGRILDKDEIFSLKLMIKSLSKSSGNEINLRKFVKYPEHVNSHGVQPTKKGKQPTKQGKQQTNLDDQPTSKKDLFPFFTWFMATVNSYMFVKSCKLSGSRFFLHPERCPAAKDVPDGSALIRTSTSYIEGHCSKTPYANLTVHIYSGGRSPIMRVAIDSTLDKKPEAFLDWLEQVKTNENVQMIRTILPENVPLEALKDPCLDEAKINNYKTRFKQTKSTIILPQQFEKMSLNPDYFPHLDEYSFDESEPKHSRFESPYDY